MRILLLGLCIGLAGCTRVPSGAPEAAPTSVTVSRPVERDVTDYADFTGPMAAASTRNWRIWWPRRRADGRVRRSMCGDALLGLRKQPSIRGHT